MNALVKEMGFLPRPFLSPARGLRLGELLGQAPAALAALQGALAWLESCQFQVLSHRHACFWYMILKQIPG